MHHAHTDTEEDPHSPSNDANILVMMWKTKNIYQDINEQRILVAPQFLNGVPKWKNFDLFAGSKISRILWIAAYLVFFLFFSSSWWEWMLFPLTFLMAPVHGAIINWFGHVYGYVNFKMKNTSKNLFPFDFLMMGEGYHNNHHKNANNANFGVKWHEIDFTFLIIKVLDAFGFISLKKN